MLNDERWIELWVSFVFLMGFTFPYMLLLYLKIVLSKLDDAEWNANTIVNKDLANLLKK